MRTLSLATGEQGESWGFQNFIEGRASRVRSAASLLVEVDVEGHLDPVIHLAFTVQAKPGLFKQVDGGAPVGEHVQGDLEESALPAVVHRLLEQAGADSVASITVHFHTTQTRVARDEHGDIMEDSDTEPREFVDIWTFERDLTLADPNWKLAETESADDDR